MELLERRGQRTSTTFPWFQGLSFVAENAPKTQFFVAKEQILA